MGRVSVLTSIWRRAPPPDRSRPPPRPIRTAILGSNEPPPRPAHGKPRLHGWGPPRGPGEPAPRSTPLLGPVPRGHVPEALHLALLAPTPETPAHDLPKEVSWRLSTALSTCAREIGWVHVSKATQSMRQTGVGGGARAPESENELEVGLVPPGPPSRCGRATPLRSSCAGSARTSE